MYLVAEEIEQKEDKKTELIWVVNLLFFVKLEAWLCLLTHNWFCIKHFIGVLDFFRPFSSYCSIYPLSQQPIWGISKHGMWGIRLLLDLLMERSKMFFFFPMLSVFTQKIMEMNLWLL